MTNCLNEFQVDAILPLITQSIRTKAEKYITDIKDTYDLFIAEHATNVDILELNTTISFIDNQISELDSNGVVAETLRDTTRTLKKEIENIYDEMFLKTYPIIDLLYWGAPFDLYNEVKARLVTKPITNTEDIITEVTAEVLAAINNNYNTSI